MRPRGGNRFEALEPIRQGVAERFAGLEADVAEGLKVRHDHGPRLSVPMTFSGDRLPGHDQFAQLRAGARGNGYCEWFIRILKENLLWVPLSPP